MQDTSRGSGKVNSDVVPLCNALTVQHIHAHTQDSCHVSAVLLKSMSYLQAIAGVKVKVTRSEEALAILSR